MSDILLAVIMRWLHVAGVAVLVGSLAFVVLCASPAARWLADEHDLAALQRIERRLRLMMAVALVAIVTAGLYNWMLMADFYRIAGPAVYVLVGVKVAVAAILIAVLWAQDVGLMVHPRARFWRAACLVLALGVMLMGAIVRHVRLEAVANHLAGSGGS